MPKKRTKQAQPTATKPSQAIDAVVDSIFDESLAYILTEIRGIRDGSIRPEGHDAASRVAWLAQRAAAVAGERRKAITAEHKRIEKITKVEILAALRKMDPIERASLLREGARIDEEGSVLA